MIWHVKSRNRKNMKSIVFIFLVLLITSSGFIISPQTYTIQDENINSEEFTDENFYQKASKSTNVLLPLDEFLIRSTYFGGNSDDYAEASIIDSQHNLIIVGHTASNNFPMLNAYNDTFGGGLFDVFVAKFTSTNQLIFSTYLGGSDMDQIYSVAIDSEDNIIVAGNTQSSNFPMKNSYNSTYGGLSDVFVAKLTSSGQLIFSTYLGGSDNDNCNSVITDDLDNIFISGNTKSGNFPLKASFDSSLNGISDVFIAKFTSSGILSWSTYLGGSSYEITNSINIDSRNNVILNGYTASSDFPVKNAYNSTFGGSIDTFITKFTNNGQLTWSTFFGGLNSDFSRTSTIDSFDNIILAGTTDSNDLSLKNPYFNFNSGSQDVFLAKYSSTGELDFSTYLGGFLIDDPTSVIIDHQNNILVTGVTYSSNFPLTDAFNTEINGTSDAFLTKFSNSGEMVWSTLIGGSSWDVGTSVNIDAVTNIFAVGYTTSNDFIMKNSYNDTYGGANDIFIAKLFDPTADFDQDGLVNIDEYKLGLNFLTMDTDGDLMTDSYELCSGLNPIDPSDANGDLDGDKMPNLWEFQMNLKANDSKDALEDKDNDKLINVKEYFLMLNATDPDTDNDYLLDGEEVFTYFTNPLATDSDGDTLEDGLEVLLLYTNPTTNDTDGDGIADNVEILAGSDPLNPKSPIDYTQQVVSQTVTTTEITTITTTEITTETSQTTTTKTQSADSFEVVFILSAFIGILFWRKRLKR